MIFDLELHNKKLLKKYGGHKSNYSTNQSEHSSKYETMTGSHSPKDLLMNTSHGTSIEEMQK